MKIDDKEIEKLLKDFEGEDIKIPDELDEKLNLKLKNLKPKKYKKWISTSVASILILGISYTSVPSFKAFGDSVFKYIFGDIGVEYAVNNGYDALPNKKVNIAGYDMSIENIYIDDLRISFDAIIENNIKDDKNQYSLYVDGDNFESISVANGIFEKVDNKLKTNVQIIGDGVAKLIEGKDVLELELEFVRHYSDNEDDYKLKNKTLGKSKLILDIDNYVKTNKDIKINKIIEDKDLKINIEKLEVSPTMMYLNSYGQVEGVGETEGLYNFKIVSDKGDIYKENLVLSGVGKGEGWRQSIVPSIYYDKNEKLRLKAGGVLISANKSMEIDLKSSYPKEIDYFGTTIVISRVEYKDDNLIIEILDNNRIDHVGVTSLDDNYSIRGYYNQDEGHGFVFDVKQKDKYNLDLGLVLKYELPIDIEIDNKK